MLLKHTSQRFMVASVPSWRAWGFHANIGLKKLPEGENIFGKQFVKDSGHSAIIGHSVIIGHLAV